MADPRVLVCFQSKAPHNTWVLFVEAPADAEPGEMYRDLQSAGWRDDTFSGAPPFFGPDGYLVVERHFVKRGSALFAGWTPAEKKTNVAEARRILARHGFVGVPHQKLTLADLL